MTNNAVNIAINIQHSPKRPRLLSYLLASLNHEPYKIITDTTSTWSGCRRCLTERPANATHILVLQDDVIVCPDFFETVNKIVNLLPDQPITFFCRDEIINEAKAQGLSWVKLKTWFMAQAYVLPVALADEFVGFSDKYIKPDVNADDQRLAMFFMKTNRLVYATAPSLVEHIGWQGTTIRDRTSEKYFDVSRRVAKWFIGYEESGLQVDWLKGLDNCPIATFGDWSMFCDNYVEL